MAPRQRLAQGVSCVPYAALTEEELRRAQAAFAQIGLVWTLPTAALERERAAIRERVEAAIAAAMSPDERALFDAARTNDVAAVKALLAKGVSPEVASVAEQFEGISVVPGMPPLHVAIRARSTEAALALLEGGADPPPLAHAARFLAQLRARGHAQCADLIEAALAKRE